MLELNGMEFVIIVTDENIPLTCVKGNKHSWDKSAEVPFKESICDKCSVSRQEFIEVWRSTR